MSTGEFFLSEEAEIGKRSKDDYNCYNSYNRGCTC